MSEEYVNHLIRGYVAGTLSRRQFIVRGLALGLSLASVSAILAACAGGASPKATELSVIAWGGGYGDALRQFVSGPYETERGTKVLVQEQSQAAQSIAKLQAEISNPTIDVWLTTGALPLQLAKAGGLLELTPQNVPNLPDIIPALNQTLGEKVYGAGIHLAVRTITVDRDRIKDLIPDFNPEMLNSWEFLWRPELKDQVALNGFESGVGTAYIGQAMHRGASQTDEETFFKAMRDLAPNVHLDLGAASGIGQLQLFQSKEITVASNNMTDAQELAQEGIAIDVGYPQDPLITILDYVVAIKDGPAGPDAAFAYVNKILDPVVQTPYLEALGNLPTNTKAEQPELADLPPISVDTVLEKAWAPDYDLALQNYDAWFERYNTEIVPLFGG